MPTRLPSPLPLREGTGEGWQPDGHSFCGLVLHHPANQSSICATSLLPGITNQHGRCSLTTHRFVHMFLADMETSTPDPADRFTILRQELRLRFDAHGPMHGIEGVLRVLLFGLFMCLINLAASRAERAPRQQACPDDAGAGPAASAAVAAAGNTPAIDCTTHEDCIRVERGARTACARPPREQRHRAAIVHAVAVSNYGNWVLRTRFAKMGLRAWVELRQFREVLATITDCGRN